jgi:hypothetical protein
VKGRIGVSARIPAAFRRVDGSHPGNPGLKNRCSVAIPLRSLGTGVDVDRGRARPAGHASRKKTPFDQQLGCALRRRGNLQKPADLQQAPGAPGPKNRVRATAERSCRIRQPESRPIGRNRSRVLKPSAEIPVEQPTQKVDIIRELPSHLSPDLRMWLVPLRRSPN